MKTILILNGPNLNLLSKRQPQVYGQRQIVDLNHTARETTAGIVNNPGASTHTSVAVLKALNKYERPMVEVHFRQEHKREVFRHHSDPLVLQVEQLGQVYCGEEPPVATDRDGLSAIAMIDAIKTTSATGQTVEV